MMTNHCVINKLDFPHTDITLVAFACFIHQSRMFVLQESLYFKKARPKASGNIESPALSADVDIEQVEAAEVLSKLLIDFSASLGTMT